MTESIFLAQYLGSLLVILGLTVITHKKMWLDLMNKFMTHKGIFYLVVVAELLAGLALVITHNIWSGPTWVVIITAIGWLALLEAILYLMSSWRISKDLIKAFNKPGFYNLFSLVAIVVGAYLAYIGFTIV